MLCSKNLYTCAFRRKNGHLPTIAGFPEEDDGGKPSPPGYQAPPDDTDDDDDDQEGHHGYLTDDEEEHAAKPTEAKMPSNSMATFYAIKVCTNKNAHTTVSFYLGVFLYIFCFVFLCSRCNTSTRCKSEHGPHYLF